jgi:CheY-like chemotaxis protein
MRKNTILWADDDYDDLQMMRELLLKTKRNYDLVEVHNGKEALDYLRVAQKNGGLPSLIILDINMPVMDGKETLAVIKNSNEFNKIPVVVFSTSESELDKIYCQRLGSVLITKPPTFSTLSAALDQLLQYCD